MQTAKEYQDEDIKTIETLTIGLMSMSEFQNIGEFKMDYNNFENVGTNLYKLNNKYYRLFGMGVTPNGCWIIAPKMVNLIDIDIATGKDIYGNEVRIHDIIGTVSATKKYIGY